MQNASTAGIPKLSDLIGALEIDAAAMADHGVLETAAISAVAGPTQLVGLPGCHAHIEDGALEAGAAGPTTPTRPHWNGGPCIGDDALEAAAVAGPQQTLPRRFGGTCIWDDVLEAAAINTIAGPTQLVGLPGCHAHIDDGVLEAAIVAAAPMRTVPHPVGTCVSDIVLEGAAAMQPPTFPPMCHHIEQDGLAN